MAGTHYEAMAKYFGTPKKKKATSGSSGTSYGAQSKYFGPATQSKTVWSVGPSGKAQVSAPQTPYTPTTTSSGGGGGGGRRYGGGGGGGGGSSQISQAMFDSMLNLLGRSRPDGLKFNKYSGQKYRSFNEAPYTQAREQLTQGTERDLAASNAAYDQAQAQMDLNNSAGNPYAGGLQATSADLGGAMGRMLAANQGAGADAARQVSAEGAQADAAMGNVAALLAATDERAMQGRQMGLTADRGASARYIQDQARGLEAGINMARAKAYEQYQQEKWMYGEQVAMMNWQRRNEVLDQNAANLNTWKASVLGPAMQLLGLRTSAGTSGIEKLLK